MEGRGESGYKRSWWFDESDSPKVSSIDLGHEWEDPTFDEVCEKEEEPAIIPLDRLTEKQRFVIECSYGVGRPEITEQEIAELMGITQQSVHGIKRRALRRLRGLLDAP